MVFLNCSYIKTAGLSISFFLFRIHKRDEDGDEFGMENFVYPCRKYATEKYEPTETPRLPFLPSVISEISSTTQCHQ